MNTKHTPGPWTADKDFHVDCPIWAGQDCIATAWAAGEAATAANAALIAAAPELLEVCKRAVSALADFNGCGQIENSIDIQRHLFAVISKADPGYYAIAKAEGRS